MGPLLYTYILTEVSIPFGLSLVLFSFILFLTRMLKIIEPLVNYAVPLKFMFRIVLAMFPTFLELTLPMALLLGGLLACGRLAEDGELMALRSTGQTTSLLSIPIWTFSLAVLAVTGYITLYAGPNAHQELKRSLLSVSKSRLGLALKERTFFDRIPNLVLYIDEVPPPGSTLKGVLISDTRDPSRPSVVVAKVALVLSSGSQATFRLIDGAIHSVEPDRKGFKGFHRTAFNVYDLTIDLDAALGAQEKNPEPRELSLKTLRAQIRTKQKQGEPTLEERVEFHRRFALPFSCIVFAVSSILFGLRNPRITRPRATVTGLAIISLYFVSYAAAQSVATKGFLPPSLGAWLPNILVGVVEMIHWGSTKEGRAPSVPASGSKDGKPGIGSLST